MTTRRSFLMGLVLGGLLTSCNAISAAEDRQRQEREWQGRMQAQANRDRDKYFSAECRSDADCGPGGWCSSGVDTIVCKPRLAKGSSCTEARQCANNVCQDGACATCTSDAECHTWLGSGNSYCSGGECYAKNVAGEQCAEDRHCRSTLGCIAGKCSDCTDDSQCRRGTFCTAHAGGGGGTCQVGYGAGTKCGRDRECAKDWCDEAGVCRTCRVDSDCGNPNLYCQGVGCADRCQGLGSEMQLDEQRAYGSAGRTSVYITMTGPRTPALNPVAVTFLSEYCMPNYTYTGTYTTLRQPPWRAGFAGESGTGQGLCRIKTTVELSGGKMCQF